jgi:uncharacterized Zn finger protein
VDADNIPVMRRGDNVDIECEECGGTDWTLVHLELKVLWQKGVISALRCKKCGMAYMLADEGKNVSADKIKDMLRKAGHK